MLGNRYTVIPRALTQLVHWQHQRVYPEGKTAGERRAIIPAYDVRVARAWKETTGARNVESGDANRAGAYHDRPGHMSSRCAARTA
jgi:hypothetical protein